MAPATKSGCHFSSFKALTKWCNCGVASHAKRKILIYHRYYFVFSKILPWHKKKDRNCKCDLQLRSFSLKWCERALNVPDKECNKCADENAAKPQKVCEKPFAGQLLDSLWIIQSKPQHGSRKQNGAPMKPKRQHHAEKHIIDKRVKNTSQKKFWESRILLFHKSSFLDL